MVKLHCFVWLLISNLITLAHCNSYEPRPISSTLSPINRKSFNVYGPSSTPSPRDQGPPVSVLPPPNQFLMQFTRHIQPQFYGHGPPQHINNQYQHFQPNPIGPPPSQFSSNANSNMIPIPSGTLNVPFIQYVNKLKATYFPPPRFVHPQSSPFKFNQDYLPQSSYSTNPVKTTYYSAPDSSSSHPGKDGYVPYGHGVNSDLLSDTYKFSSWRPVPPSTNSRNHPYSTSNDFNSFDNNNQKYNSYNSEYNYEDTNKEKNNNAQYKVLFIKTTPNSQEVHFPGAQNGIREFDSPERQRASLLYLLTKESEPKIEKVVRVPLPKHLGWRSAGEGQGHGQQPNVLYVKYNKPYTTVSDYGVNKEDYYENQFDSRESKVNEFYKNLLSHGVDTNKFKFE